MKDKKVKIDEKLILDVNRMVLKGLLPIKNVGRYRNVPVVVNDPRKGEIVYLPPDEKDVLQLMQDLILYVDHSKDLMDPVLLAGILHKQFVVIHPFIDGNGRTARLLTKVLLAGMGLDTFNLFSFENYYNKNVTKYFQNIGVYGDYYEISEKIDFTSWLEYFTDGIIDELLRVSGELNEINFDPKTVLKDYHQLIIRYINKHGFINDREYSKLTERAKATRILDFDKLIKLGLIKRVGKGRATYYVFK